MIIKIISKQINKM
jgi:isocitrate dehydrogenase